MAQHKVGLKTRRVIISSLALCTLFFVSIMFYGNCGIGKAVAGTGADTPIERTINVSGEGLVKVKPDVAYIRLEVVTQSATAQEAQSENAKITKNVLSALKGLGLTDDNLSTAAFGLRPIYSQGQPYREEKVNAPNEISGYRAQNQIMVSVSPDLVGKTIDTGISAGCNQVLDLEFSLKEPYDHQIKALKLAVKDGTAKAKALADAAGYTIGDLKSINSGGYYVQPLRDESMKMLSGAGVSYDTPIVSGDVTVRASVQMTFTF